MLVMHVLPISEATFCSFVRERLIKTMLIPLAASCRCCSKIPFEIKILKNEHEIEIHTSSAYALPITKRSKLSKN